MVVPGACDFVVEFDEPSATDDCDPNPDIECTPSSGSMLGLGLNTIQSTATDASGNSSDTSFTVTVLEPLQVIFEQPPLDDDNARDDIDGDNDIANKFKVGQVIPVKVKILDCFGNDVMTSIAPLVTFRLDMTERDDQGMTTIVNDVPEEFNGVGSSEGIMVLNGNHFQFNLDTDTFDPSTIGNPNLYFRAHVTVEYDTDPTIVVGEEDALLESK